MPKGISVLFCGRTAPDKGAGAGGAAAAAAASFPPAISTSSAAAHRAAHIAQPPRAAKAAKVSEHRGWSEIAPRHGRLRRRRACCGRRRTNGWTPSG